MNIATIGVGYVGLVTSAVFADLGNDVISINRDRKKSENLKRGTIPIYEQDLADLVKRNVKLGRLKFTTKYDEAIPHADIVFIAVGTPSAKDGSADISQVKSAAEQMAPLLTGYTVVATKSTVPVGTNRIVEKIIAKGKPGGATFDIASVPEFLREGSAVYDTLHPDRTVIGADAEKAREYLIRLHKPLNASFVLTSIESAEMLKYTANSFLAMKISFANAIAEICEYVGADIVDVMDGIGMDHRIGRQFLSPGPGYGGSCFPKDVRALIAIAKRARVNFKLLEAVEEINHRQIHRLVTKVTTLIRPITGKTIGVLGLTFKANTDDTRASQPIALIAHLSRRARLIRVYDPIAMEHAKRVLGRKNIYFAKDPIDAAHGSDALIVMTEWEEFVRLDFTEVKRAMNHLNIVDARNLYDPPALKKLGFRYMGMGR